MARKPLTRASEERFQQVIVRMPPEMHEQVKERAEVEDRTMAQTIRRALRMYLEGAPAA